MIQMLTKLPSDKYWVFFQTGIDISINNDGLPFIVQQIADGRCNKVQVTAQNNEDFEHFTNRVIFLTLRVVIPATSAEPAPMIS